jgi:outer membrane receptor protein involved in Fe transport
MMMSGMMSRKTRFLICVCGLSAPFPAFAQAAVADAVSQTPQTLQAHEGTSGDIVVTATGRAQRLRDVPVSVLAVSGADLQKQAIVNLETFAIRQPGFRISQSPASDYIAIRGIGSSANIGFEQSVGTFVDGLYRGRSRDTRMALFDVDRIELLRGPQTTFFGNNTIGGALNIVTRKPGRDFGIDGSAYYSPTYGEYSVEAGVDLPTSQDLRFRVSARQSGSDGYIKNVNTGDKGPHLNDTIGRIAMAWTPGSVVSVDARLDLGRMRDTGVFNVELLDCAPPAVFGAAAGACGRYLAASGGSVDSKLDLRSAANASFFNYDFAEGEVATRIRAGAHTITLTTGYFGRKYALLNDPVPVPGTKGGSPVGTTTALPIALDEHYRQVSQEIRIASDDNRPVSYIASVYYQYGRLRDNLYQGFYFAPLAAATGGLVSTLTPVAGLVSVTERSDQYSGFGAVTVRPAAGLRINIAGRYTQVDKNDRRTATIGTAGSIPGASNFVPFGSAAQALLFGPAGIDAGDYTMPHRSDGAFLPSASIQYDLAPSVMAYVSYAKGFKAGGFSIGTTKSSFEPEKVDAYEAGIKASLFDRLVDLTLTGFHSKYRNLQETATVLTGTTSRQVVTNAARSVADGVEASLTLHPTRELTLSANTTYMRARYEDYRNAPCTTLQTAQTVGTCTQDLSGVRRAFAPAWSGNVAIDYSCPITAGLRIDAGVSAYYSSRYFVVPTGDARVSQPGFAKIDARLALASMKDLWEIAIIGRNLTDKLTASYRQVVPSSPGALGALAEPPRSIGLQVRFKYR